MSEIVNGWKDNLQMPDFKNTMEAIIQNGKENEIQEYQQHFIDMLKTADNKKSQQELTELIALCTQQLGEA